MLAAERGGTQFTDEEILGNLIQIIPGPDALMMLISNAVLTLLRHPDQLALLKKDPTLIGGAVEECLRYDSLILGFPRVATEDVNVRGQLIHKGQQVFPLLRSANRDPVRFPDPDRLDITRQHLGQLSFGHGVHSALAERILDCGGAWASEYPPGVEPRKEQFVARNRIQSGLSAGSIIVEGARSSGTMTQAQYSLDQRRKLFAVVPLEPGNPLKLNCEGPTSLVESGQAAPVRSIADYPRILEQMELSRARLAAIGRGVKQFD